jgi:hypothetical protein
VILVDALLVFAAATALPVYGFLLLRRWRAWRRYRDARARREANVALLIALIATAVFVSVFLTRAAGLGVHDPARIAAVAAMTAVVLVVGLVFVTEWPER